MAGFLLRRVLYAILTVIATAFFAYGTIRVLRPELYPGEATPGGLWHDVTRALLHLDLGESCMFFGCPPLKRIWLDGVWADLFLLAGGVVVGLVSGVLGGVWCAARPRSRSSRALEAVAMVLYCSPAYVVGLGVLLLFAPPFGLFHCRTGAWCASTPGRLPTCRWRRCSASRRRSWSRTWCSSSTCSPCRGSSGT